MAVLYIMTLKIGACMFNGNELYLYFNNILQNLIFKILIAVTIRYWWCNMLLIIFHLIILIKQNEKISNMLPVCIL